MHTYSHLHKYKYSGSDFHRIPSQFLIFCSTLNFLSLRLTPSLSFFTAHSPFLLYLCYVHKHTFCLLHTRSARELTAFIEQV